MDAKKIPEAADVCCHFRDFLFLWQIFDRFSQLIQRFLAFVISCICRTMFVVGRYIRIHLTGLHRTLHKKLPYLAFPKGSAFKHTDNRCGGIIWYMNEHGQQKRKSFSKTIRAEVNKKMTDYISDLENRVVEADNSKKALRDSIQNWLQIFKSPSVKQTIYA